MPEGDAKRGGNDTSGPERSKPFDLSRFGVWLLVLGAFLFFSGLFDLFDLTRSREETLVHSGEALFVVGIVLVAVSLYKRGRF